ncbi:MAG: DNA repair protein RecO [Microgenomates group bacterium]
MSGTYKTEGIILKRKNFGEADKILTIYSKHYGKIRAIAKGVRKLKSRKAGSLELFNHCRLVLAKGRNLDIISEVEVINTFRWWRENLTKVGVAWYFCELVDKLTPDEQANKAVFELLKSFLEKIDTDSLPNLVRSFEEHLLDELGFGVPSQLRNRQGSLKSYIESITEKEVQSPKILAKK